MPTRILVGSCVPASTFKLYYSLHWEAIRICNTPGTKFLIVHHLGTCQLSQSPASWPKYLRYVVYISSDDQEWYVTCGENGRHLPHVRHRQVIEPTPIVLPYFLRNIERSVSTPDESFWRIRPILQGFLMVLWGYCASSFSAFLLVLRSFLER